MVKKVLCVWVIIIIAGCIAYAPTVPDEYQGDLALINDTYDRVKGGAHIFYVKEINGDPVRSAFETSDRASLNSSGPDMAVQGFLREVPADTLRLTIAAQRLNAVPIYGLFNKATKTEGEVDVELDADEVYVLEGIIDGEYAAVWMADIDGNRVSEVVESGAAEGSTAHQITNPDTVVDETNMQESRQERFARLSLGEHKRVVERKIGPPDSVEEKSDSVWVKKPNIVIYSYEGLGDIHMKSYRDGFYVENIAYSALPEDQLTPSSLGDRLSIDNGESLRNEARNLYQLQVQDSELLDAVAQRLWDGRHAADDLLVDAMAWFCRVLGQSGSGRYRALLDDVSTKASDKKLRRYAGVNRDQLPHENVQSFVPSSR